MGKVYSKLLHALDDSDCPNQAWVKALNSTQSEDTGICNPHVWITVSEILICPIRPAVSLERVESACSLVEQASIFVHKWQARNL